MFGVIRMQCTQQHVSNFLHIYKREKCDIAVFEVSNIFSRSLRGSQDDEWNGYNRQGILDHWAYTGEVIPDFLATVMGVVEFYANLWGNTPGSAGSQDKMVFYPTQALETWQCPGWPVNETDCPTNDMPTVAGRHSVLEKPRRDGGGNRARATIRDSPADALSRDGRLHRGCVSIPRRARRRAGGRGWGAPRRGWVG